jgi:hypothetical protein
MGTLFLQKLSVLYPGLEVACLVRPTSDRTALKELQLNLHYCTGDCASSDDWDSVLSQYEISTIIHLVQLRHIPKILSSLAKVEQTPRLMIVGTTGVFSRFNEYSQEYREAEACLDQYKGSYCLLRPTMIYGSERDKNIHKLIQFCDRYGFFFVFGSGKNLIQPVHADDLAQALLAVYQRPEIQGAYDLSGGSVVSFRELLNLVAKSLAKPVRQLSLPLSLGVGSATILEAVLGKRSPVRREQILRLQEDKAYSYQKAHQDFGFTPRTLDIGLQEEVALLRQKGLITDAKR